jgi:porphobilinogen synthase
VFFFLRYGIGTFILFPKVPDNLKTNFAEESYNPNGIVPRCIELIELLVYLSMQSNYELYIHIRALAMIKSKYPDAVVCTDIALDPYSDQGHDGFVRDKKIMNDITIMQLQKQAVMQARAGSDCVAPSDMMDGNLYFIYIDELS